MVFVLGFTEGVSKHENSRQGRIRLTKMTKMNSRRVSYTLASIDYKDLDKTKLVDTRAKNFEQLRSSKQKGREGS